MDDVLAHEQSMVGTPGFYTLSGASEALGKVVQALENQFDGDMTLILR